MSSLLWVGVGAVAGAVVTYLIAWAMSASIRASLENARFQALKDQDQIDTLTSELRTEKESNLTMRTDLERAKTTLEKERESFHRQLEIVHTAETRLKEAFKALASEALAGNNVEFMNLAQSKLSEQQATASGDLELRKQAVESLVQPISDTLQKLNAQVQQLEVKREGAYGGISAQIDLLTGTQKELKVETARLVSALKTPDSSGDWGEFQLREVVKSAGMLEHYTFKEQQSYKTDDEKTHIPDMVIQLPNGREIVVDSKVSAKAYLEAMATDDENQRAIKLREHAERVKARISELSAKAYWKTLSKTPEFVIVFLPRESMFSAALQQDPLLLEYGSEQKVILASPTTLIALLKAVAYGWQEAQLTKNAEEIRSLGKQLYERLWKLTEQLEDLRSKIDGSVKAFDATVGSLKNVLVPARKFHSLGASVGDEMPGIDTIEKTTRELPQKKDAGSQLTLKRIAAVAGDQGEDR